MTGNGGAGSGWDCYFKWSAHGGWSKSQREGTRKWGLQILQLQQSRGESMAGMIEMQESRGAGAQWASRERKRWLEESASVGG